MLGSICHVGLSVRHTGFVCVTGFSDIADYMFLHPTLLDLKIQGLWLGSRMFFSTFLFLRWTDDAFSCTYRRWHRNTTTCCKFCKQEPEYFSFQVIPVQF